MRRAKHKCGCVQLTDTGPAPYKIVYIHVLVGKRQAGCETGAVDLSVGLLTGRDAMPWEHRAKDGSGRYPAASASYMHGSAGRVVLSANESVPSPLTVSL